jgi:hypothetical protein
MASTGQGWAQRGLANGIGARQIEIMQCAIYAEVAPWFCSLRRTGLINPFAPMPGFYSDIGRHLPDGGEAYKQLKSAMGLVVQHASD